MGVEPCGIRDLIKWPQRAPLHLLPGEGSARRCLPVNREQGPHQTPSLLAP